MGGKGTRTHRCARHGSADAESVGDVQRRTRQELLRQSLLVVAAAKGRDVNVANVA